MARHVSTAACPDDFDIGLAFATMTDLIDQTPDPDDVAYRLALRLLLRHEISGVIFDPTDDDFAAQVHRLRAEADRLEGWNIDRWNTIKPAGDQVMDDDGDAPF